jgi:hypothetical protein
MTDGEGVEAVRARRTEVNDVMEAIQPVPGYDLLAILASDDIARVVGGCLLPQLALTEPGRLPLMVLGHGRPLRTARWIDGSGSSESAR